eukprot:Platyproteum_vivax@DN7621_c1_g1_i1.p1
MSGLDAGICKIENGDSKGRELRCSKRALPGTVILSEAPYVYVPKRLRESCHLCLGSATALMPCSVCKSVVFCSKDCQRKAWKNFHKFECKILHNRMTPHTLLIIRIMNQKLMNSQPDLLFDDLITNKTALSPSRLGEIRDLSTGFSEILKKMPEFGQHQFCDAELL